MPPKRKHRKEPLLTLVDRVVHASPNIDVQRLALAIHLRLRFPMPEILEKIPGKDITAKADAVGASRMSYYSWMKGETRPRLQQAIKIAEVTGYKVHEIAGTPE